jgi:Cu+-exporting ATPase
MTSVPLLFPPPPNPPQPKQYARQALLLGLIGIPLMILSMLFPMGLSLGIALAALTAVLVGWVAKDFFKDAFQEIRQKKPGMNTLFLLGTTTAFVYSCLILAFPALFTGLAVHLEFASIFIITALVALGRAVKAYLKHKTEQKMRQNMHFELLLQEWQPLQVNRVRAGKTESVLFTDIVVGDLIELTPEEKGGKIKPARLSIEGIYKGQKPLWVVAPLSGEAVARVLQPGDTVQAGTQFLLEKGDKITIEASHPGKESSLYQLLLKTAQFHQQNPPFPLGQALGRRFAPIIILLAAISALAWGLFGPAPILALTTAASVLLCACPCAFFLASPVSTLVAGLTAMKEGIYIRDIAAFEKAGHLTTIVFDKTGTLTDDVPSVQEAHIAWGEGANRADLWQAILALESKAYLHPSAKALLKHIEQKYSPLLTEVPDVSNFKNSVGKGVQGVVRGKTIYLGQWDAEPRHPLYGAYCRAKQEGMSPICVIEDNQWVGIIPVKATVKLGVKETLAWLTTQKINIKMLTGDEPEVALQVAQEIGLAPEHVFAKKTPDEKAAFIEQLQQAGHKVAMLGDGLNDLRAIQKADVGISIGTDASIQASIILPHGDIIQFQKFQKFLKIARLLRKNIQQNLIFSMIYNTLSILMAAGVLFLLLGVVFNPIMASVSMAISSAVVLLNAARLKNVLQNELYPPAQKHRWIQRGITTLGCVTVASLGAGFTCAFICGHSIGMLFSVSVLTHLMPFCAITLLTGYAGVAILFSIALAYGVYRVVKHCQHKKETKPLSQTTTALSHASEQPLISLPWVVEKEQTCTQTTRAASHKFDNYVTPGLYLK